MFGKKKKREKIPVEFVSPESPSDRALREAALACDEVNRIIAEGNLPRNVRFWFDFNVRPIRMVLEERDFSGRTLYPPKPRKFQGS